jgi:hypothetical protein
MVRISALSAVNKSEVMMSDKRYLVMSLFLLLLAGCSAISTPRLIAAYPSGVKQPPQPPSPSTYPQPTQAFVYHARLEIEAWRPSHAADKAVDLAARYGGYLVSSNAWRTGGKERVSLALAVPLYNFDALYTDLQGLGKVVGEQVWGEWQSDSRYPPGGVPGYSQITLEIASRGMDLRLIFPDGWNPGRTFASAMRVSAAIYRTLLDASIWLLVLIAPLVLIVLGVRFVIQKIRS